MIFLLSFLSGVLGRCGGAAKSGKWYDFMIRSITRDLGCSTIFIVSWCYLFGFSPIHWWVYSLVFGLTWASFSTYWDWLFGYDCLWFSGFMVGCAAIPLLIINSSLWGIVALRIGILTVVWWFLNRKLPQKVFIWGRDVAEEFLRYCVSL